MTYTAVVLSDESHTELVRLVRNRVGSISTHWEVIAHHMTVNMGRHAKGPATDFELGTAIPMLVETIAVDHARGVVAVGVSCPCPTLNDIPHITVVIDREAGAKPFHSNLIPIERWVPFHDPSPHLGDDDSYPILLGGILMECT